MAPCTVRPLLLTVGLVTLGIFFQAPSFGIGALYYRDPYSSPVASLATRLHEETRYAATLKARQGLIKKHGPSKEEIESYPATGSYSTQYGTSSSRPSSAHTTSSEFIDVLKNDFEGAKFDTLTAFLAMHKPLSPFSSTTLPIGQLQIELHARDDCGKLDFFHDRCAALEAAGMRPFLTKSNLVTSL
ncbi:hypothetical protein EDB85DRAFT_65729 [Lactarius pseudohatsudake]|nr:hypothetical protein EDB85DRAFT_65729 [Lactarius pseudohatsudake]